MRIALAGQVERHDRLGRCPAGASPVGRCHRPSAKQRLRGGDAVPKPRREGRARGIHSAAGEKADGFANPCSSAVAMKGTFPFAGAAVRRNGTGRAEEASSGRELAVQARDELPVRAVQHGSKGPPLTLRPPPWPSVTPVARKPKLTRPSGGT
ncbi:hypothetical protein GCM10020216_108280 [Nonomuraea helvata]